MAHLEIHPLRTTQTMAMISDDDLKINAGFLIRIAEILLEFDGRRGNSSYDPVKLLQKLAELLESATDIFIKNDPDPLDDRHPHRTHPDSALGNVLKIIFKNDDFMTTLVVSYILCRDNLELSIQGCRVLLACVPGLDSKVVFSEPDDFIPRLYQWAGPDGPNEMLQGYAMGLLAAALENTENAGKYRNENAALVPFALDRLRELQIRDFEEHKLREQKEKEIGQTDFSELNGHQPSSSSSGVPKIEISNGENWKNPEKSPIFNSSQPPPKKRRTEPCLPALLRSESSAPRVPSFHNLRNLDDSNSKWDILQPFLIGTQQVYPLSLPTYQRYILQYLAACGEYQDLLLQTIEGNAQDLLSDYIDLEKTKDVRLTFDALKYLTSLLVHRKFALEFVEKGGIEALLRLPRNSLASVGVVTCFFYIAYSNDVMEKLCQMSDEIVDETIQYVLWCLEHSYESGKASACMFFSQALFYKAILSRFDQFDGPRKLCNYMATLTIMRNSEEEIDLTEEQIHTSTQCVRGVCATFRSYLSAHILNKVHSYKRQYENKLPTGMRLPEMDRNQPPFRSMKGYEEMSSECETIVLEMYRLLGGSFVEIENMRKLELVRLFLAVRVLSRDWMSITSGFRNEMCLNAMESLQLMLCLPAAQNELIPVHSYNHINHDGFTVLFDTAMGRYDEDSPLRMAALGCIQRCVYVDNECWKVIDHRVKYYEEKSKKALRNDTVQILDHLEKMWSEVRKAEGIRALIELIGTLVPVTEADSIRRLATNTLCGLARHPEVRQIISKLPLIANSNLQIMMRDPVCPDKRDIHAAFCKEVIQLLQIVTGRKLHDQQVEDINVKGVSDRYHRQWVIENTKVNYNETELLQLIHDHLVKNKLESVAAMLKTEAKLPDRPASRSSNAPLNQRPLPSISNNFTKIHDKSPALAPRVLESEIGGISARRPSNAASMTSPIASRSLSTEDDVFATPTLPRRYTTSGAFPKKISISPARSKQKLFSSTENVVGGTIQPYKDLSSIVTDFFRNQHSACQNPVTTCPPFSLFYPHKCPEKSLKTPEVRNFALRNIKNDYLRRHQQIGALWSNERDIFSRFRNVKNLHDHDDSYTKATFSVDDEHLIVGLFNGEVHWINVDSGADEGHTNCHGSALSNIEPSQDGSMILTSCAYSRPLSALWRIGEVMQRMHTYREESCVKFGNTTSAKIIGTASGKAILYDTETNHVLETFTTGINGLEYEKNFASFSPDDKMVFNDGILWDVRKSGSPVHIFDRLNTKTHCGTFHPHGTQIIIDSEVYDIRTFKVLQYVPELSKCQLSFNSTGNIMYANEAGDIHRGNFPDATYLSFRTFDTRDYRALTTVEGRRPVIDLCSSHHDQTLCVIEQSRAQMSEYLVQASTQLRIMEVGRMKDNEDENEEEEEDQREDHNEEEEEDDDDETDNDEDDEIGGEQSPARGSVFDALGRLGDESDSDNDVDDDSSDDGFDFENALNRIIRRQAQRRRQRANSSENNDGAPENVDGEDDDDDDENEGDPDFDVDEAIDDLVNAVDEEVDEEEEDDDDDDDDGSWRTASRIGSEDINLDELDEEEALAAEEEGREEEEARNEAEIAEINARIEANRVNLDRVNRALRLEMNRGNRRRGGAGEPLDVLNARAEGQRIHYIQAIARQEQAAGGQEEDQNRDGARRGSDNEYHSEEEEINSVASTTLNPAMRRRNRRHQNDDN